MFRTLPSELSSVAAVASLLASVAASVEVVVLVEAVEDCPQAQRARTITSARIRDNAFFIVLPP
jgi:hypothetical protein